MPTQSAVHILTVADITIHLTTQKTPYKMPIKIKIHKIFEPNMPKVPITQLRALWAPPLKLSPQHPHKFSHPIRYPTSITNQSDV
jgi:hypothetical protein